MLCVRACVCVCEGEKISLKVFKAITEVPYIPHLEAFIVQWFS